jgi:class 3 adenylate cyclase
MAEVRERIDNLKPPSRSGTTTTWQRWKQATAKAAIRHGVRHVTAASQAGLSRSYTPRLTALAALAPADGRTHDSGLGSSKPSCRLPLSLAVTLVAGATALLACGCMNMSLMCIMEAIRKNMLEATRESVLEQRSLSSKLVFHDVMNESIQDLLRYTEADILHSVKHSSDQAVDAIWSDMVTWHRFDVSWDGWSTSVQRATVAYRTWVELRSHWDFWEPWNSVFRLSGHRQQDWLQGIGGRQHMVRYPPHLQSLYVGFSGDQFSGAQVMHEFHPETLRWFHNKKVPVGETVLEEWRNESNFCGLGPDVNDCVVRDSDFHLMEALGGGGNQCSSITEWATNNEGNRIEPPTGTLTGYCPTNRPWYKVQRHMAESSVVGHGGEGGDTRPLKRAWTEMYLSHPGSVNLSLATLSWTAPVAYCGDYSCFEGVISADVILQYVSLDCRYRWEQMRMLLGEHRNFAVGYENSTLFIVNHISRRTPWQEGMLVGAAHWEQAMDPGTLTYATDSGNEIVRKTTRALLAVYNGSWDQPGLQVQSGATLAFRPSALPQSSDVGDQSGVDLCEEPTIRSTIDDDYDCWQVGTLPVQMDEDTWWLVVAVLPRAAFSKKAIQTMQTVDSRVNAIEETTNEVVNSARITGVAVLVGLTLLSVALGYGLGTLASNPLRQLDGLLKRLGELDVARDTQEFQNLRPTRRSRILEVSQLQRTFVHLSRGIEAFARFVPETVVRNIVRGDPKAKGLSITSKEVTIMMSDIRGFTSVAESLSQDDLLFVLTEYLAVMTGVIEKFDGVVAEVQGDGLLVYFGAPDDVEDHAAKACAAALAQHQALEMLNVELLRLGLPRLGVRIGIHTGTVWSGNIGSDRKMKFGCLGDSVHFAVELEGLCNAHGVGVICSDATRHALPPNSGIGFRELGSVQAEDREVRTIYEVTHGAASANGGRDGAAGGAAYPEKAPFIV